MDVLDTVAGAKGEREDEDPAKISKILSVLQAGRERNHL